MALRGLPSLREPGLLLSGVAHVALIVAGLVAVSAPAELPSVEEGIAVEMITESQFSEITRGERDAAEVAPVPAPRAERVAETPELRPAGEDARDTPTPAARPPEMEVADRPVPA
ncbi:cell envelope integrity protein TolA, partial [Salinarimonas sp. NSM]